MSQVIALVDDDRNILTSVSMLLEAEGFAVKTYNDGVGALEGLNDRDKHILMERRLADEPKTLEELSQVYGVSRERIRQIEVRAFEKLQAGLLRLAGERRLLPAA